VGDASGVEKVFVQNLAAFEKEERLDFVVLCLAILVHENIGL